MTANFHEMISGVHNSYGDNIVASRKGVDFCIYIDRFVRLFNPYTKVYSRMRFDAHKCKQKAVSVITKFLVSMDPYEGSSTLIMMVEVYENDE